MENIEDDIMIEYGQYFSKDSDKKNNNIFISSSPNSSSNQPIGKNEIIINIIILIQMV